MVSKMDQLSCLFWAPFDEKCTPIWDMFKTADSCTFHIDAQHWLMTPIDAPQPHVFQIPSIYMHSEFEMVRWHSMARCTDTDNTCLPELAPLILKWAMGPILASQKSKLAPGSHVFFCFWRPANGKNKVQKWGGAILKKKKLHFCIVHFSSGKKQIRENTSFKKHAFCVDPLGVLIWYSYSHDSMFFRPRKGGTNSEKKRPFGDPTCLDRDGPQKFPKGPFRSKKFSPKRPFRVLAQRSWRLLLDNVGGGNSALTASMQASLCADVRSRISLGLCHREVYRCELERLRVPRAG